MPDVRRRNHPEDSLLGKRGLNFPEPADAAFVAHVRDCIADANERAREVAPVSMETVSTKKNRVYQRKFDHDEAIVRYAAGESPGSLAREYGVSEQAVRRVVVPGVRNQMDVRSRAWIMSGVCQDCGKTGIARQSPRCKDCAELARAPSVRADELLCSKCRRWLPDDRFHKQKGKRPARRGRKHYCKDCDHASRRDYRDRHKVPCSNCGQPTSPAGDKTSRRSDGSQLCLPCTLAQTQGGRMALSATFIVLQEEEEGLWREIARPVAKDKRDALAAAINGGPPPEGRIAVVSTQAFKPGRLKPIQVYDLETD